MRYVAVISLVLSAFLAQSAHARPDPIVGGPQPHDGPTPWVRFPAPSTKALVDTLYIMGGPGSLDGSFETAGGLPDWQGWTHEDLNTPSGNHWHISTYWAENLGGHGPGNFAMNCVDETIPACDPPDTIGGYGHNWFDDLEWRHAVADTSQPVTVRLTGFMNYDLTDADWDFLEFFVQRGEYPDMLATWTGTGGAVDTLDFTTVLSPAEYSGPDGDEVRLWWRVWSDGAYDDVDCKTPGPGHGAARIDDIAVFFDDSLITFDDFEPGSPVNWTHAEPLAVGDFTNLRNDLGDIDPCQDNNTYQVNFVDDGVVVPGTGGTPCITWCYDPGGWIVNNTGGLLENDPSGWFIENQVVSPPLPWLPGTDGAELSFDVYVHEQLFADSPGVFYLWHVRSTASPDPADLELASWTSRNFVFYGDPDYKRHIEPVSDLLVADRQWVQIALGVNEMGWMWNWTGLNGTPAPYFDNVTMRVWAPDGPEILVKENNLFGDAFPEQETFDPTNLVENWCRVDMAGIKSVLGVPTIGDSLTAQVTPLRQGATVPDPPSLHWVMECNPTFDSVRPGAPNGQGILRGMISGGMIDNGSGTPLENQWSFDLPDTGWFFPGDRLRYYITATGDLAGDLRTSVWPPDTTAVLDFTPGSSYPRRVEARALPTLTQPVPGQFTQPSLLFYDSTGDPEAAAVWYDALHELGFERGVDYDAMAVRYQLHGYGIGLGAIAKVAHLADYQTMLLTTGTRSHVTLSGEPESNDAKLVSDWLDTGGKQALFAGDGLCTGLVGPKGGNDGYLLMDRLGVGLQHDDISEFNGGVWDLQISPVPGNGILPEGVQWLVDSGCPEVRRFDAISPGLTGQTSATLDPEGTPGGTYAAVLTVDDQILGNRTTVLPFDLERVSGLAPGSAKSASVFSPRADLLNFLLVWLGADGVSDAPGIPGIRQVAVYAHPNPFNPSTTIAFELPRAMDVSLDIYDLQGRLVRRLLDESPYVNGSHKQVWDGRDAGGQVTASGVYFYMFGAGDQKRVGKLT
ncbi:MAG: hypothetical protein ABFS42_11330, partial [Candidatus Krumholzibacteriota bacterium]